jgi:hypothetical protein
MCMWLTKYKLVLNSPPTDGCVPIWQEGAWRSGETLIATLLLLMHTSWPITKQVRTEAVVINSRIARWCGDNCLFSSTNIIVYIVYKYTFYIFVYINKHTCNKTTISQHTTNQEQQRQQLCTYNIYYTRIQHNFNNIYTTKYKSKLICNTFTVVLTVASVSLHVFTSQVRILLMVGASAFGGSL